MRLRHTECAYYHGRSILKGIVLEVFAIHKPSSKHRVGEGKRGSVPESSFADPTTKASTAAAPAMVATEAERAAVAANREAILQSPSYKLAETDIDFISRKENRPLRMQLELLKTETLLRENRIDSTIVVFGGTQIVPRARA